MRVINNLVIVLFIIFLCVVLSGCTADQNPGTGTLNLTSKPPGAEIYIDNQFGGSTPSTIAGVTTGMHNVELRLKGYQSWSTDIMVSPGTYQLNAVLTPVTQQQAAGSADLSLSTAVPTPITGVTVKANKEYMIIGDSIFFSGTGTPNSRVILTLYGTGKYANGVRLDQPNTNSVGSWSYTWNPGFSVQSGAYTLVVDNPEKTLSGRVEFPVIGGGEVTITANRYFAAKGNTITFSGRCTSGAKTVSLKLTGPDRYSSGVEIAVPSVAADKTWSYVYTFDSSMPQGYYTMNVNDIPRTGSGYVQFSLGSSP